MAKADVELAIRARDEASKALGAIKKTTSDVAKTQDDLKVAATGTAKALREQERDLGKVGTQLAKAQAQLSGLEEELRQETATVDRLGAEFQQLGTAVEKSTRELADAAAPVTALGTALKAASDRIKLLRDENRSLTVSSNEIRNALDGARDAAKPLGAAISEAKEAVRLAAAEFKKANADLNKSSRETDAANAAYARLEKRTTTLGEKFATSKRSLDALNAELAKAAAKKGADGAFASKSDENAYTQLADKVARATARVQANEAAVKSVNNELTKAGQRIAAAGRSYDAATEAVAAAEAAFNQQQASLAQAKARADEAAAGMARLNEQLEENKRKSRDNATEVAKLVSERQSLNGKLAEAAAVQRQANAALKEAEKNASSAGAALQKQQARVERLGQRTAEAKAETAALASRQQELGTSVQKTSQRLAQQESALRDLEGQQAKANRGLSLFNDTGRTTLSFTQRLRGQILSLAAAYGGLFGAVSLVRKGIALQQQESSTQSRLNVLFDGDAGKAASELKMLRQVADELGFTYQNLAEQYSKVAIAATAGGATIEQTRAVFFGLTEVSRGLGLSTEQNERIFTAISQIFSKTKITAEELSQQLGDSLPGAVASLAKSMNITTKELYKQLEAGTVSAQNLVKFVKFLREEYAAAANSQKNSITAELERTQTVLNDITKAFNTGFFVGFGKALAEIRNGLGGDQGLFDLFKNLGTLLGQIANGAVVLTKVLTALSPIIIGFGAAWAGAKLSNVAANLREVDGGLGRLWGTLKDSYSDLRNFGTNLASADTNAKRASVAIRSVAGALNLLSAALTVGTLAYQFGKLLLNLDWVQIFSVRLIETLLKLKAIYAGLGRVISSAIMLARDDYDTADFTADLKQIDRDLNTELKNISNTVKQQVADINSGLTDLGKTGGASENFDYEGFVKKQQEVADKQTEQALARQAAADAAEKAAKKKEKADKKAAQAAEALINKQREYDNLLSSSRDRVEDLRRSFEAFDDKRQSTMRDGVEATLDSRLAEAQLKVNAFEREAAAIVSDAQKQIDKLQNLINSPDAKPEQRQTAAFQKAELEIMQAGLTTTLAANKRELSAKLDAEARLDQARQDYADYEAARQRELADNQRLFDQGRIDSFTLQEMNNATVEETGVLMAVAAEQAADYAAAIGRPELAEELRAQAAAVNDSIVPAYITAQDVSEVFNSNITSGLSTIVDGFAQAIAGTQSWGDALRNLDDTFRQFAANVLRDLAQMILKYTVFRALSGFIGGFAPGFANFMNSSMGIAAPVQHGGGTVSRSWAGPRRTVNPAWFANAQRFHSGGLPGLKRDEVPAILQTGEEVLSRKDPRNALNGGAGQPQNIKIVNAIDSGSVLSQGISTRDGEKAIMNFMRANKSAIKQVLA